MKRRRQRLQVSTFPFLAVLLCTMGSLILLLLVIDRRAKAVARAKALQAAAQAAADDAKQAADTQAGLERQAGLLHLRLAGQDQELLARVGAVSGQADAAARGVADAETRCQDMQTRTEDELGKLARRQAEIRARRTALSEAATRDDAARNELARLTVELQSLERTLADLKWARQQQQQTYSLVPYRGRQGDNRRPLYVECTAHGLVFHPDHLALEGPGFVPGEVRAEVERRLARQRAGEPPPAGPARNAYVLMLVRPDGIATYYKALEALEGLKLDYGYEFVERDWVLNFQDDESFAQQPWVVDARARGVPQTPKPPLNVPATGAPAAGPPPGGASDQHAEPAANSGQAPPAPVVTTANEGTASQAEGPLSSWSRQRKAGLRFTPEPPSQPATAGGPGNAPAAGSLLAANSTGEPPRAPAGGPGVGSVADGAGGPDLPGGASADQQPAASSVPGFRELRGNALSEDDAGGEPAPAAAGPNGHSGSADPAPGFSDRAPTGNQSPPPEIPSARGSAEATPGEPAVDGSPATIPGLAAAHRRDTGASAPELGGHGSAPGVDVNGRDGGADADTSSVSQPLSVPLAPPSVPATPNRPAVARPGLLNANRDWIIPIECRGDGVMLVQVRLHFPADTLSGEGADNLLATAVRQLVQRRQAGVLPGEPPYRPLIRFLVRPDGLRSYYMAYPLLEPLRLPMARVSIHPEDEGRRGAPATER